MLQINSYPDLVKPWQLRCLVHFVTLPYFVSVVTPPRKGFWNIGQNLKDIPQEQWTFNPSAYFIKSFNRPFLTGRCTWAGHETTKMYVNNHAVSHVLCKSTIKPIYSNRIVEVKSDFH